MTLLLLPCLLPNQITLGDLKGAKWFNGLTFLKCWKVSISLDFIITH